MKAFGTPASQPAIREAVLDAGAQKTSLRIVAGRTRSGIGKPCHAAQALDVTGVTGITRYEPGALTLEAKAGTPIDEIETALAEENQLLAFEPMDHRMLLGSEGEPTIGGVVACNVSGPRRFLSGACRDFLLGVHFVDGSGRILRNGGRVMKNVTGLDLTKLICGAHGTLGVVTQVALKVLPRPERSVTLQFEGLDETAAVRLFCKAVTTPYEVSGAAWQAEVAMLRIEGLSTQVDYRLPRLMALFKEYPGSVLEGEAHDYLWTSIRDVHAFSGTKDSVWKISVKPTDAPALISAMRDLLKARAVMDQGGSLIWLAVPSDERGHAECIRDLVQAGSGHATLIRASKALREAVPVFQPLHPRLERITDDLRLQFDPSKILNPGLMAS